MDISGDSDYIKYELNTSQSDDDIGDDDDSRDAALAIEENLMKEENQSDFPNNEFSEKSVTFSDQIDIKEEPFSFDHEIILPGASFRQQTSMESRVKKEVKSRKEIEEEEREKMHYVPLTSDSDICGSFSAPTFSISNMPECSTSTQDITYGRTKNSYFDLTVLDGTFFKYVAEKSSMDLKKMVALCVKCQPKDVEIRGYGNSTSNFISHLKRRHGNDALDEYRKYVESKRSSPSAYKRASVKKSQINLSRALAQQTFEDDITKYIIHSMIPLRTVEDPYFLSIFNNLKISERGLTLLNCRSLSRRIETLFQQHCSETRKKLKDATFVCTTVDIWSAKKINFLTVTAHWIGNSLNRISVALACRRIRSSYTYDNITDLLHKIYSDFGLNLTKILATITDNGSNFVKAFNIYGVKLNSSEIPKECNGHIGNIDEVESDPDINNEEIFEQQLLSGFEKILPTHLKCCAHILNLCVTSDAVDALQNSTDLSHMHYQVIRKCNYLWKSSERPKSAAVIENILGHSLNKPETTKWNSLYDSLKQIVNIKDKIAHLFTDLNINVTFHDQEFLYLEEHLACAAPIAEALDLLHDKNNTYYGIVLPCLLALHRKLRMLTQHKWIYCKPLLDVFLSSVETRFYEFFNFTTREAENAAVAALSYPRFKNRWFPCVASVHHEHLLSLFKNATASEITAEIPPHTNSEASSFDDFFDFGVPCSRRSSELSSKAELQVLHYFDDEGQGLDILTRYPDIKKVFVKYNTPLPSSAPVERLFSYATMTNLPKSHELSDETFEKRMVLKSNLVI